MLIFLPGAREASLAARVRVRLPQMLRAHLGGKSAVSLLVGLLGRRRAQHDMVAFSPTISLLNVFANGLF